MIYPTLDVVVLARRMPYCPGCGFLDLHNPARPLELQRGLTMWPTSSPHETVGLQSRHRNTTNSIRQTLR
ncbi:hypothetical protein JMJ77_0004093, partial [Colletotrichum scovillei]